jgi:hypothetical protein
MLERLIIAVSTAMDIYERHRLHRATTTPGNPARSKWSEHEDGPRNETSTEGAQSEPMAPPR